MSLIIINNKTLKNTAIVNIKNKDENISEDTKGDITIIKSGDEVVGINIKNYKNYFEAKEGAHTLNEKQVKAISDLGHEIKDYTSRFIIGKIIEKEIHPKSKKLFVLKVKTDKIIQIVTNLEKAKVGERVVIAKPGATLPSGIGIKDSKVMGISSEGMICGEKTLGKELKDEIFVLEGQEGEPFIL